MFLIEKYFPRKIEDSFFHKDIIEFLKNIKKDKAIPNVLLYGMNPSCGKKSIMYLLLSLIFNESVYETRKIRYEVSSNVKKIIEEEVEQSDYHCEIEPKGNNFDRYLIRDIVEKYAKKNPLIKAPFNIIVIHNFERLTESSQYCLRVIMEEHAKTCRFIILSNSLSKIKPPILSRNILSKIPSPTDEEMLNYVKMINEKENIKASEEELKEYVKNANGNIKELLWQLEFKRQNVLYEKNYKKTITELKNLILSCDIKNISETREIFFKMMITNIEGTQILEDLTKEILIDLYKKQIDKVKIKDILELACLTDNMLNIGRRELYAMEYFFINIMRILIN